VIVVQGWVQFAPDDVAAMRAAAADLVAATRVEEGCLDYAYAEDLHTPGLIWVNERWRDEAALNAHLGQPHIAAFNAKLRGVRISAARVVAYGATGERVLMGR
jgi:quinol monooxygenase YgiN